MHCGILRVITTQWYHYGEKRPRTYQKQTSHVFYKTALQKKFTEFTGNHLLWVLFLAHFVDLGRLLRMVRIAG